MTTTKWDKISKKDAAPLLEQIALLDYRDDVWMNCHSLHGLDIYRDIYKFKNEYTIEKIKDFVYLGSEKIHSTHDKMIPTVAEMFAQLPRRYAHKINGIRISMAGNHKDTIEDTYRINLEFYQRKEADYVHQGPLSARQMYIDVLKNAMNAREDRTGMLEYSSLPDATKDRKWMAELRELLTEAEQMIDSDVSDAVARFWLKAFRQR